MRVTREQDFAFDETAIKGGIHTTGSAARQVSEFLRKVGMKGLDADINGRAIGDLITLTGNGSGHCYTGDVRASWCAEQDGLTRATIEFTTVE
jgi:hypothetical protein